jgi:hypothetical protein
MASTVDPSAALALASGVADVLLDDAVRSAATDGGPFAALVLDAATGEVVCAGTTRVTATTDPTAHAEVNAIRAAAAARTVALTGLVLVSTRAVSDVPGVGAVGPARHARLPRHASRRRRRRLRRRGLPHRAGNPEPLPTTLAGMRVLHLPHEHASAVRRLGRQRRSPRLLNGVGACPASVPAGALSRSA